uniref:Uncharacterized protein n=1 Tax=Romanomermis culicivorax TaxID=13658 RepID=A0A915KS18_ROMCU
MIPHCDYKQLKGNHKGHIFHQFGTPFSMRFVKKSVQKQMHRTNHLTNYGQQYFMLSCYTSILKDSFRDETARHMDLQFGMMVHNIYSCWRLADTSRKEECILNREKDRKSNINKMSFLIDVTTDIQKIA